MHVNPSTYSNNRSVVTLMSFIVLMFAQGDIPKDDERISSIAKVKSIYKVAGMYRAAT